MAGQIVVSSIKTDSDNSISFLANTGATIFSANISSCLSASSFGNNTITSDKIVSVANTKITGLIQSAQIGSVSNTALPTGSVLQVVSATKTDSLATSSTSFTDVTGPEKEPSTFPLS